MTQMQEKLFKAGVIDEYGNAKFSKDGTIYGGEIDYIWDSDEKLQDVIRRNPQAAVEGIYHHAVRYMQQSFENSGEVVLTDKEIEGIAKKMFERLGIDTDNFEMWKLLPQLIDFSRGTFVNRFESGEGQSMASAAVEMAIKSSISCNPQNNLI